MNTPPTNPIELKDHAIDLLCQGIRDIRNPKSRSIFERVEALGAVRGKK